MDNELNDIANHLEDVFWDSINNGNDYESAHEAVDYWVGNNYIPGLVDLDTDETNDSVLDVVYSKVPTEEEFEAMRAEIEGDHEPDSWVCGSCHEMGEIDELDDELCPYCGKPSLEYFNSYDD